MPPLPVCRRSCRSRACSATRCARSWTSSTAPCTPTTRTSTATRPAGAAARRSHEPAQHGLKGGDGAAQCEGGRAGGIQRNAKDDRASRRGLVAAIRGASALLSAAAGRRATCHVACHVPCGVPRVKQRGVQRATWRAPWRATCHAVCGDVGLQFEAGVPFFTEVRRLEDENAALAQKCKKLATDLQAYALASTALPRD